MPFTFETSVTSQNVAVGGLVLFKFKLLDGPLNFNGDQFCSFDFIFELITTNISTNNLIISSPGLSRTPPLPARVIMSQSNLSRYCRNKTWDTVGVTVRVLSAGTTPGQASFYIRAKSGPGTGTTHTGPSSGIPFEVNSPVVTLISAVPATSPPLSNCETNVADKNFTAKFLLYPLNVLSRYPATIYLGPRRDL